MLSLVVTMLKLNWNNIDTITVKRQQKKFELSYYPSSTAHSHGDILNEGIGIGWPLNATDVNSVVETQQRRGIRVAFPIKKTADLSVRTWRAEWGNSLKND